MTKKQKIWLGVFLGMFLVPEILWSPVSNFYYELLQTSSSGGTHPYHNTFLQHSDNLTYLKLVIFLQFLGLLLFYFLFIKNSTVKNAIKWLVSLPCVVFLLLMAFALYFASTFSINVL